MDRIYIFNNRYRLKGEQIIPLYLVAVSYIFIVSFKYNYLCEYFTETSIAYYQNEIV